MGASTMGAPSIGDSQQPKQTSPHYTNSFIVSAIVAALFALMLCSIGTWMRKYQTRRNETNTSSNTNQHQHHQQQQQHQIFNQTTHFDNDVELGDRQSIRTLPEYTPMTLKVPDVSSPVYQYDNPSTTRQ